MAANCGTFFGGQRFAIIGGSGTRITATTPASQQISSTWRHGAKIVTTWAGEYPVDGNAPDTQPYDGRGVADSTGVAYDHGDNVNPGATGSALVITSPCTLIQSLSLDDADVLPAKRWWLRRRDPIFFLASAPATDSLPPPIGAVPLVPRYTKADLDRSAFPSHAAVTGAPSTASLLAKVRGLSNFEFGNRGPGDWYAGKDYEDFYASDQAKIYGEVALALCTNLDTTTWQYLAAQVVIHAQNLVEALNAGARYNIAFGLGGTRAGRKLFVVLAYIITGDAYFGDWANRLDWAAEDTQARYADAAAVAAYDYVAGDEDMPDWNENWDLKTGTISRVTPDATNKSYLPMFARHHIPQALACMMVTGAKASWNNNAFFDLADRHMERFVYFDSTGDNKHYRILTGGNSPSTYHKAFWDAHRSDAGMPAIWNW